MLTYADVRQAASFFRSALVDHQLRCSGVYSAVKISQVAYADAC
jgi:myosin heavy subunit